MVVLFFFFIFECEQSQRFAFAVKLTLTGGCCHELVFVLDEPWYSR